MTEKKPLPTIKPSKPLPAGAWDCHAHIFGPFDRYPLLDTPPYHPPLGPLDAYLAMLDGAGFEHGVVVHPSAMGWDNSATSDGVGANLSQLRGIGVVPTDISDTELEHLDKAGLRGVRITDRGLKSGAPGTLAMTDLAKFAPRFRNIGWHFQIWCTQELTRKHWDEMKSYGVPVIFDHMAFCEVAKGVDHPDWQWFLSAIKDSDFHIKMGPGRVSTAWPNFEDVRPFHDSLVEAVPDQLVFSTDWPFIGLDLSEWNAGKMIDLFDQWTPDETLRQKVFVDTPARFYGQR